MTTDEKIFDIAIIGAGAAGTMGVLRSVLNNKSTIVFKGNAQTKKKSRATWVSKVVNMPLSFDVTNPITYSATDTFKWIKSHEYFSQKFADINDSVLEIKKENDLFVLKTSNEESYQARFVLLATGIMDVQPEIQGSIKPILPFANHGHVDYCARCDGHKTIGKISATIGHTATAAWVAIMLHERYLPPEMKIFLNGYKAEFPEEAKALIELYGIKIVPESIHGIKGSPKESMQGFELLDQNTQEIKFEAVEIAFAMLGQIAYNDLAKQLGAEINSRGNVVCNPKGESSVSGLYVAGDLRDTGKYQIYTAWDQAVDSIDDMDLKLRLGMRELAKQNSAISA